MKFRRRGLYDGIGVVGCLLLSVLIANAQSPSQSQLVAPDEVVLYVPPALKSRDFIDPLVCALKRVLVSPVKTAALNISFGPDMLATRTQLDVVKVGQQFWQATAKDGSSLAFKYLLLPYDLKVPGLNYVFSTSFGNNTTPYHYGVVSTARLDVSNPLQEHHKGADITAHRVYKLILKSIARVAGLASSERCILAFPRSLAELDQKSAEFCPEDRAALVSAAILKADERDTGDCILVSDRKVHLLFALRR